ncbi:hypothetical protein CONCODRAFT_74148 [Conidiobolus coronatus NRRL 28638]|uniref:Uncharacterized protein n=1 Tax=Conidiobolus coronatus (strain ATCC 28846 / CBS 209.66 / NRRL 28638) TaxID=796925 RepID=A0A137NSP8_CONC2|nr:hypothetical protein CONCODRAFT_74148 [Conidiobolus coronatus NRRL 28638]|eukprot:KXN65720.1 hypothetical protein CONCODRAFT_74148 [Conidiobolus coronatus NRRL 28638]
MPVPQVIFGVGVSVLALGVLGYVTYQMYCELEEREKKRSYYELQNPPPPYTREDREKFDREQILHRQREIEERVRNNLRRVNRQSNSNTREESDSITQNLHKMPQ